MVAHAGEEGQGIAVLGEGGTVVLEVVVVAVPVAVPCVVAEDGGVDGHAGFLCDGLLFLEPLDESFAELHEVVVAVGQVRVSPGEEVELLVVLDSEFEVVYLGRVGRGAGDSLPEGHENLLVLGQGRVNVGHVS